MEEAEDCLIAWVFEGEAMRQDVIVNESVKVWRNWDHLRIVKYALIRVRTRRERKVLEFDLKGEIHKFSLCVLVLLCIQYFLCGDSNCLFVYTSFAYYNKPILQNYLLQRLEQKSLFKIKLPSLYQLVIELKYKNKQTNKQTVATFKLKIK